MVPEQRRRAFDNTVELLSCVLPKIDQEKGQLYEGWEEYNRYLQHMISLRDIFDEDKKAFSVYTASQKLCQVFNEYQRQVHKITSPDPGLISSKLEKEVTQHTENMDYSRGRLLTSSQISL